jgi:hypothetical protein
MIDYLLFIIMFVTAIFGLYVGINYPRWQRENHDYMIQTEILLREE